ncbi:hypothetical protein AB6C45_20420 [Vibrio splendidus]
MNLDAYLGLFSISLIVFIFSSLYFKVWNSTLSIWFFGTLVIFAFPVLYGKFGGTAYRVYTEESLNTYLLVSCYFLFISSTLLIIRNGIKTTKERIIFASFPSRFYAKLTYFFIVIFLFLYFIYYFNHWPFVAAFSSEAIERPDTVKGVFKGYFTYSLFVYFVLPAVFLKFSNSKTKDVVFILCVSLFLVLSGNKGVLLYFFIFYIMYKKKDRLDTKTILSLFFCILMYFFLKGSLLTDEFNFLESLESPLRRMFVTQGISIPIRMEMVELGILSDIAFNEIKNSVFNFTYGYPGGSMPVIMFGDLFVKYGMLFSLILSTAIIFLVFVLTYYADKQADIFIAWIVYMSLYILIMSGLSSSNFYRFIFALIVVLLYIRFDRYEVKAETS